VLDNNLPENIRKERSMVYLEGFEQTKKTLSGLIVPTLGRYPLIQKS
jgi:hypothetical protein